MESRDLVLGQTPFARSSDDRDSLIPPENVNSIAFRGHLSKWFRRIWAIDGIDGLFAARPELPDD